MGIRSRLTRRLVPHALSKKVRRGRSLIFEKEVSQILCLLIFRVFWGYIGHIANDSFLLPT